MDKYMDNKNNSSNDRRKNVKKKTTQKKTTRNANPTKKRVGLTEKQKKLPQKIQDAILKKQKASN